MNCRWLRAAPEQEVARSSRAGPTLEDLPPLRLRCRRGLLFRAALGAASQVIASPAVCRQRVWDLSTAAISGVRPRGPARPLLSAAVQCYYFLLLLPRCRVGFGSVVAGCNERVGGKVPGAAGRDESGAASVHRSRAAWPYIDQPPLAILPASAFQVDGAVADVVRRMTGTIFPLYWNEADGARVVGSRKRPKAQGV
jgi:hypothetical protein